MDAKQKLCAIGCTTMLIGMGVYVSIEAIRSANGETTYAELSLNAVRPYIENVAEFLKGK